LHNRYCKTKFKERRIGENDILKVLIEYITYDSQVRLKEDLGRMSLEEFLKANSEGNAGNCG